MSIELASEKIIEQGVVLIRGGSLVAFPTETVYGLGADATNDAAVARIFAAKGRPNFNPLIVHVSDAAMAQRYVKWNDAAEKLSARFWPGPLTLVLPRKDDSEISLLASAGGDTLGIRVPAHPVALNLIKAAATPIAAPSANRSGRISPTTAKHVLEEFNYALALIIDGGACSVGVESTVLDLSEEIPVLLRHGGVTKEAVELVLGKAIITLQHKQSTLKSPGLLESHYAPGLPVRLNVLQPHRDEALIAFGGMVPAGAKTVINLSVTGNDVEAAARLFATMRELDLPVYAGIAVMPIPDAGLGAAMNDRLRRAAAERP